MNRRITQFSKFILKKIIRGVAICDSPDLTSSNIYKFIKVELNDDILNEIIDEGTRYHLTQEECVTQIRMADERINTNPAITRITSTAELKEFPVGTHLNIAYRNDLVGKSVVSVIVGEDGNLVVLDSDLGDIEYRDILRPLHRRFNCGSQNYFDVYRKGKLLTKNDIAFSPGTLEYIEKHQPGLVYDILDTDKTFACSGKKTKVADKEVRTADGEFFATFPSAATYPPQWPESLFFSKETEPTPFIIKKTDKTKAILSTNPRFRFNKRANIFHYENNQIFTICDVTGNIVQKSYLTTTDPGRLEYDKSVNVWVLKSKPKVLCRRLPDDKYFRIVASAIWQTTRINVTDSDIDTKLTAIGIKLADCMCILLEMESIANIRISQKNAGNMTTIRDFYDLLINEKNRKNGK